MKIDRLYYRNCFLSEFFGLKAFAIRSFNQYSTFYSILNDCKLWYY